MTDLLKPFAVEFSFSAIVMARDSNHARHVAENHGREIFGDVQHTSGLDVGFGDELKTIEDVTRQGYTGGDLPYGGDGQTSLDRILAALDALPTRDTKTIDMFSKVTE